MRLFLNLTEKMKISEFLARLELDMSFDMYVLVLSFSSFKGTEFQLSFALTIIKKYQELTLVVTNEVAVEFRFSEKKFHFLKKTEKSEKKFKKSNFF